MQLRIPELLLEYSEYFVLLSGDNEVDCEDVIWPCHLSTKKAIYIVTGQDLYYP